MLSRLDDFMHQFLECGLIIATCKRNTVFLKKNFSELSLYPDVWLPTYCTKAVDNNLSNGRIVCHDLSL